MIDLFFFLRESTGKIEKMDIMKDRENNLIGQILYLIEERQLHKIEELSKRFCYDCLIIRSKHADHCKLCN